MSDDLQKEAILSISRLRSGTADRLYQPGLKPAILRYSESELVPQEVRFHTQNAIHIAEESPRSWVLDRRISTQYWEQQNSSTSRPVHRHTRAYSQ